MQLNDLVFALLSGSVFLLSFLLILNITRVNTNANTWLGVFYFCLGCAFFQQFLERAGFAEDFPLLVHLAELSRWAPGPSIYLAVCCFVNRRITRQEVVLHLIPASFFIIYSALFITPNLISPAFSKAAGLPPVVVLFIGSFSKIQGVCYWTLSYTALVKHRKNLYLTTSTTNKTNLSWIRYFLIGVLIMLATWILGEKNTVLYALTPLTYVAGIFHIAYFSLKQTEVYPFEREDLREVDNLLNEKKNYERLTLEQLIELKNKVAEIMNTKKLHLNPDLSLPVLSKEAGINIHDLSYILNKGFKKTFYQYINEMRIEEAKALLISEKKSRFDMVGIAYAAGFNSKTTFYTTFKKSTGQSPADFARSSSGS